MNNHTGACARALSRHVRGTVCAAILAASLLCTASYGADTSVVAPPDAASDIASDVAPAGGTPTAEDIASMLNTRFHIGLHEASKIGAAVLNAAKRDTISPFLLLAIIEVESRFDRFAVSVVGAKGLMQILPSQHRDLVVRTADLTDADTNVSIGSSILHDYIEASDGDVHDALLRYSGGAKGYPRRVNERMNMIRTAFSVQSHDSARTTATAFRY
jgi:soluble lytic murein transglycosylase-like protein